MRTTIDLPDELLQRVKAGAALDVLTLKELITRYVAKGLEHRRLASVRVDEGASERARRNDLPVMIPARGRRLMALSSAKIQSVLDAEEMGHAATAPGPP